MATFPESALLSRNGYRHSSPGVFDHINLLSRGSSPIEFGRNFCRIELSEAAEEAPGSNLNPFLFYCSPIPFFSRVYSSTLWAYVSPSFTGRGVSC